MTQITHKPDEDGVLRQVVSPETLRRVLAAAGDNCKRPKDFGPLDEWDVGDDES